MEEIVIPNLDDDDDDNYPLPPFARPSFGSSGSTSSLPEIANGTAEYPSNTHHRANPSSDNLPRPAGLVTPARPHAAKGSTTYSHGAPTPPYPGSSHYTSSNHDEQPRLGKLSNGSNTSLLTSNTSIGSAPGFLAGKKGSKASLTSLRNAFKSSAVPVPPVPNIASQAYPALRNPFSRYDAPASPAHGHANISSSPRANGFRKQSTASARSMGGRSVTSQGSSGFRQDEHAPALPPIPSRSTPSRMTRRGSDSASSFAYVRNGSIGGFDGIVEASSVRTAGEEALRVVWRDLREAADSKVTRICARPLNTHPSLPAYLDKGVDEPFDTLITSFAHCGKRHARHVADLVNGWCRQHCEGIGASEVRAHLDRSLGLQMRVEDAAAILGARKSSVAKYILNRLLIELVKITPRDMLGEELGMMLEQNAFNAYRLEKVEELIQVPHKRAVSQLQIELLGQLSRTRFLTVSDRFTRELSKYASSAQPTKEAEARIEHLLRGMRHLKLKVYPEDDLEMSAEFIQQLAAYFANTHGQNLKCAYAETFTALLHPVIETATAEVNHPMWSKAIAIILARALAMMAKPRYWSTAFPLVVVALGVSPREVFMQQWPMCIEHINAKVKDRMLRPIAMNSFVRLLWVYLNRCTESSTSMRKRLEPLLRSFFSSPGGLYPPEIPLEPFIAILHQVMVRQLDYGEDFIAEFLKDGCEQHGADRATVLIIAMGSTLRSIEQGETAPWPQSADFNHFALETPPSSGDRLPEDIASRSDVSDLLNKAMPAISRLLVSCDRVVGHLLLSNDSVTISGHASSSSMDNHHNITRKHGDIHASYPSRFDSTFRLYSAVLELIPRLLPVDTALPPIANILCRGTFSADSKVCGLAAEAMLRLASVSEHCFTLANTYLQFVFETRHVFRDTFIGSRLMESQFTRVISLWVQLLRLLVGHQRTAAARNEGDAEVSGINPQTIDKVDACGLFLLCSSSVALRRLGSEVLAVARDLEGQHRRPSAAFRYSRLVPDKRIITRVMQLYERTCDDGEISTIRALSWLTSSDGYRLDLATGKDKTKLLQRIAESDNPKDGALWLAILPFLASRLSEELPSPTQEWRSLVISTVLRVQGHVASTASLGASRATPGMRAAPAATAATRSSSDVAVLADHWRSFLSVLCATIPDKQVVPATPPVQRTKEVVILTPDTISSPALFHYLASLLTWEDPRFKDAAVYAMGSIGQNLLRPLSEILLSIVRRLADGSKAVTTAPGSNRRAISNGPLWTSLAHIFRLISPLILDSKSSLHLPNLSSMIGFVKLTYNLLSDRAVKEDFDLQSLRRSFCIVVENLTNALGKLASSERFLGEETRGAIFKLCNEWCHVGRRPDVAKARESQTLQAASEGYRGERDRAQYLEDLQAKTKLLSAAAAEAMAGLCQGQLISNTDATPAAQASDHIVEPLTVLRWIRGMFSSQSAGHHETARKALFALLKNNWQCGRLFDEVLHQSFGEGEQFALDSSFFGVVSDVLSEGLVQLPIPQVCCLALSKLGHPVLDIRLRAFQLTQSLDAGAEGGNCNILPAIGSSTANVYRQAQRQMANRLAEVYSDHALAFLRESSTRLSQLEAPRRQATLSILTPWLSRLDLAPDASDSTPEEMAGDYEALSNLMYLAIRFSDDHLDEIKEIFMSFASNLRSSNTTALVKFLFEQGGKRKSPEFVNHAQRIMACLAQSDAGDMVFEDICNFVEPSAMATVVETDVAPSPMTSLVDLDSLMAATSARQQTFSTGQLALLFASELLPYRLGDIELYRRLPTLLHVALVHSDHSGAVLREQCQGVLFQVLRTWISDTSSVSGDTNAIWQAAEHKTATLARSRNTAFWKAEDTGGPDSAFLAPPKMSMMIMKILGILLPLQPKIRQQWGELALSWATSCPIRHLACRSFQVFRILSPKVSARMVSDTLARLSSTVASASPEIQAFNLEVIRTFATIVQNLNAGELLNHPQIFWCAAACLTTPYEEEYSEVVELLSHILDKTNLADPAVVAHLVSSRPKDWVGPPAHLQALLLPGLRSSKTAMMAFDLIRRLASSPHDELIDGEDDRLIHGFLAALPWMLHSTDVGEPNEDLGMMALDLAGLADAQGNPSFSRLLTSFAHARFRAKDDFIRQAASLIHDYMATHALDIVTLLAGFVLNDNDWMREKSMQILKLILQFPEAREPLATHGTELLQPLLRLVSTKHATRALDVLDLPVAAAEGLSAGEIFGDISPSGWSIPSPKDASALTRENVTAVFNTCAVETRAASAHFSVVQFADIQAFNNMSQVSFDNLPSPPVSGLPGLSSGHGHPSSNGGPSTHGHGRGTSGSDTGVSSGRLGNMDDPSMGDLVGALLSLNEFFDDKPQGKDEGGMKKGHGRLPSETPSESRIRAILARGRNPSISSPIYETPAPGPYPSRRRHQHTNSELTESSVSSSNGGGDDATRRYPLIGRALQPHQQIYSRNHRTNASFSSSTDGEYSMNGWQGGPHGYNHGNGSGFANAGREDMRSSENLFNLEEDDGVISFEGNHSMASLASLSTRAEEEDDKAVSENTTPMGSKRYHTPSSSATVGEGSGRIGYLRENQSPG